MGGLFYRTHKAGGNLFCAKKVIWIFITSFQGHVRVSAIDFLNFRSYLGLPWQDQTEWCFCVFYCLQVERSLSLQGSGEFGKNRRWGEPPPPTRSGKSISTMNSVWFHRDSRFGPNAGNGPCTEEHGYSLIPHVLKSLLSILYSHIQKLEWQVIENCLYLFVFLEIGD